MPPLYVTGADFTNYVEGWVTEDAAALDRLLTRAERDIENLFRAVPIIGTGTYAGHRFDPAYLTVWEFDALKRAVCAQAEYRFTIGEEALAGPTPGDVKGPDFEITYPGGKGRPRYSEKLAGELAPLERFRVRSARAHA
jgi:hypothetical protein